MSETFSAEVPAKRELFLRFTQVSQSGFGGVMRFARRMLVTAVTAAVVLTTRIHPLWLFGAAGLIGLAGWV